MGTRRLVTRPGGEAREAPLRKPRPGIPGALQADSPNNANDDKNYRNLFGTELLPPQAADSTRVGLR